MALTDDLLVLREPSPCPDQLITADLSWEQVILRKFSLLRERVV